MIGMLTNARRLPFVLTASILVLIAGVLALTIFG
jgi:hypothetical protein